MGNARIISEGTLRAEDLIPAFMSALQVAMDSRAMQPGQDAPEHVTRYGNHQERLGEVERHMERDGYYDSEQAEWDLDYLVEALETYAPEGTYFGANDGDGACFGFWDVDADDSGAV